MNNKTFNESILERVATIEEKTDGILREIQNLRANDLQHLDNRVANIENRVTSIEHKFYMVVGAVLLLQIVIDYLFRFFIK